MKNILLLIGIALLASGVGSVANAQVNIIETVAGTSGFGGAGFAGDNGPASAVGVKMSGQYLMAMNAAGDLYIADNGNSCIRKIDAVTGIISTVAGIGGSGGFTGDLGPATAAKLGAAGANPGVVGVAVDQGNNFLYISDGTNNRIRMVTLATGIITTICGNGTAGFGGEGGLAVSATCEISGPRGIAVDASGNIYFSDNGNQRIRKITASTGIITTIAGNGTGGYLTDGVPAISTEINSPRGLTVDGSGNIYFADMTNSRIRRIDATTNFITTVAGGGGAGFAGDGGPAAATTTKLNLPTDVKFDAAGNMYIADVSNERIRLVTPAGMISTIAGASSTAGYAGDGAAATAATVRMSSPVSIAVEPTGRYYYISERNNNLIRIVRPNSTPYFNAGTMQTLTLCQDAAADSLSALLAITDTDLKQVETWSIGAWAPTNGTLVASGTAASNGGTVTRRGFYYVPDAGYSGPDSFIVQISDGYAVSTDTFMVNVIPTPFVSSLGGFASVCEGSTVILFEASSGGIWSTTNTNASVTGGTVTGNVAGSDLVVYTLTNACGSAADTLVLTINPLPDAGTIFGPTSVCVGLPSTFTDAATGGAWSTDFGNASVTGGTVTGIIAGTSDNVVYSVSNSCGTSVASAPITITTVPGVGTVISGAAAFCQGTSISLSSSVAGGVWSASNSNATVVTGASTDIGIVTGVSGGTDDITYALTNSCGTNNITTTVTVNPLPDPGTITGLSSVCLAGTINLMDAVGAGTWHASNANATVSASGVVTGVTVGTDVVSYSVTNGCGTSVATTTINIVSTPSVAAITGPTTVCQAANITLADVTPGGAWTTSNSNATVAGGTVTGVTAGTDIISYTVTFSCGIARATHTVTINPLPVPAAVLGASFVCLGSAITLTDASASGTWSASNTNASVTSGGVVTGLVDGTDDISYSLTNGCGTVAATKTVSVDAIVTPTVSFTALPGFTTCPSTLVTYTAIPGNGGPSPTYQWMVSGATLGTGGAFNYTPVNGNVIICKMTSSAPCPVPATVSDTVTVVVNPSEVPSVRISADAQGDTICIGNISTFTAVPVHGGTTPDYGWYVNGLLYAIGNPFTYAPTNGDLVTCALTSSYVCPLPATVISNTVTMTVNTTEAPAVSITVNPGNPVCAGSPVTFMVHALYGGIAPFYRWTRNGINVATGPEYIYIPATGDNVYAMMASSATCSSADSVFSNHIIMETVSDAGFAVSITAFSGTTIGIGQNDTLAAIVTGSALSPTYQWYKNGAVIPGATSSVYVLAGSSAGTEVITCVAGSNDACAASAISNLLPLTITANVGVQQILAGGAMKISPNPNKGAFTLSLPSVYDELVQVVITNTVGEKVKELTVTTNQVANIRLDQAAGVYFLSAYTEHGRYQAKVVVE